MCALEQEFTTVQRCLAATGEEVAGKAADQTVARGDCADQPCGRTAEGQCAGIATKVGTEDAVLGTKIDDAVVTDSISNQRPHQTVTGGNDPDGGCAQVKKGDRAPAAVAGTND